MKHDRVYLDDGSVAHLLEHNGSPSDSISQALCGRDAWPGYWFGTGSQDEYEKADGLPLCVGCAEELRRGM